MDKKVSICVYTCKSMSEFPALNEILWGIEEEGLPYNLEIKEPNLATELSYLASQASSLSVGIGIGLDDKVTVHYSKLSDNEPYLCENIESSNLVLREVGANAARIVKRISLKL